MRTSDHVEARRLVFGLAVLAAGAAVAAQVIEGPPGSGYGWGSVVISSLLISVPLLAIGFMVLSGEARFAWPAVLITAVLVVLVLMAIAGNWAEQSTGDRWLDSGVAVLVLVFGVATLGLELPLLRRSGSSPSGRPMSHQP